LGFLGFNCHHCQRFASEKLRRCADSVRRLENVASMIAIAASPMLALSLAFGGLSQKLWQLGDIKRNSPRLIAQDGKQKLGVDVFSMGGPPGDGHEALANHRGRFRSYRLHRKTR
jgi:hypothetical protein